MHALQDAGLESFDHVTYVCNPDEEIGSPFSGPTIRELALAARRRLRAGGRARQRRHRVRAQGDHRLRPHRARPCGARRRGAREGAQRDRGGGDADRGAAGAQRPLARRDGERGHDRRWHAYATSSPSGARCRSTFVRPTVADLEAAEARDRAPVRLTGAARHLRRGGARRGPPADGEDARDRRAGGSRGRRLPRSSGSSSRDAATGGMSDANTIAAAGTPVIDGLGPVGGDDHAPGGMARPGQRRAAHGAACRTDRACRERARRLARRSAPRGLSDAGRGRARDPVHRSPRRALDEPLHEPADRADPRVLGRRSGSRTRSCGASSCTPTIAIRRSTRTGGPTRPRRRTSTNTAS